MKMKFYAYSLLLSILFLCQTSDAQISLQRGDMPSVGESFPVWVDSTLSITGVGVPGPNRVWEFNDLSPDYSEEVSIIDIATAPGAESFPTANYVEFAPNNGGEYRFVQVDSDSYNWIGISTDALGSGSTQTFPLNSNSTRYKFPHAFAAFEQDTLNYSQKFGAALGFDSVWVYMDNKRTISVDGWGMLSTPNGNYEVIRQNNLEEVADTIFGKNGSGAWEAIPAFSSFRVDEYYEWLGLETQGQPVLRIDVDPENGNRPSVAKWTKKFSANVTNLYQDEIQVYPNPVINQQVNLQTDLNISEPSIFTLYSAQGQKLFNQQIERINTTIEMNSIPKGIYFYDLQFEDGRTLKSGILQVQE